MALQQFSKGKDSTGATRIMLTDALGRQKISHGQPDAITGVINAVNEQVAVPSDGFSDALFYFDPAGSHVVTFENSPDSTNGTDGQWFPSLATNQGALAASATTTGTMTTVDSSWRVSAPAGVWIRARVSTQTTTGNINVWATTTTAAAQPQLSSVVSGAVTMTSTTLTSVVPGVAATSLGKAEDAAHATGDTGVAVWGVRNDGAATSYASANGDYTPHAVDTNGAQFIRETPANIATLTNVTAATSSTTILAANVNRRSCVIYNDSSSDAYVKYGTAASATSFTFLLPSLGLVTIQGEEYAGIITGIWNTATGTARVTENT